MNPKKNKFNDPLAIDQTLISIHIFSVRIISRAKNVHVFRSFQVVMKI